VEKCEHQAPAAAEITTQGRRSLLTSFVKLRLPEYSEGATIDEGPKCEKSECRDADTGRNHHRDQIERTATGQQVVP